MLGEEVAAKRARVRALVKLLDVDFSGIRLRLKNELNWSDAVMDSAQEEYLRHLALTVTFPEENIVPSEFVDAVWHAHILDTRAYEADCQRLFRSFVHHFPYLGLRGPEDVALLERSFSRTAELYRVCFGEPSLPDEARQLAAYCGDCSTGDPPTGFEFAARAPAAGQR